MAQFATRPSFAEGQFLAAADLSLLADNPRAAGQRHARFVHRWGIVSGLTLSTEDASDAGGNAFKKVSLEPGMAIDGEGRELLVTQKQLLDPSQLRRAIGNSIAEDQRYPVFVAAQVQQSSAAAGSGTVGPCSGQHAPPKIEETVQPIFMPAGEELTEQKASALSADPASDGGVAPWLIFVGYAKWSAAAQAFADVDAEAAERFRPVVGINAGVVAGNSSRILLHPAASPVAGDAALELSQTADGPALVFGSYQSALAPIDPLVSINAKGDMTVKGTIVGKTTGTTVLMQSGIASDGMILPLPDGVTVGQVADGSARVHVQVSAHVDPAGSPNPTIDFAALVQECRVDVERRVHCRICWVSLPTTTGVATVGATAITQPGQVSYLICVSVSEE